MTVKEKLTTIIKELPESVVAQIYSFARFLQIEMEEQQELLELSQSPTFNRLAERSLQEIENNETLSIDELREAIKN
jgi:hypothetical protein